ncbi:MAG: helix-turn-helix domain-containing protein [Rickettsiales bacterium]|nr:helix-turn-helix domain-containing protein [Rickettsiales bacterium]
MQPAHYQEHYKEIGQLLKQAREHEKLTLKESSHMLHVRMRYLEALEEGRLEDLPGLPYAKGYLQLYAHFLQLDKDEVLRRFEQVEQLIEKRSYFLPDVFHSEKKPTTPLVWSAMSAMLVIMLLWWLAIKPSSQSLSTVEAYHITQAKQHGHYDVCALRQHPIYPACVLASEESYELLPISKTYRKTIMELAK